LANLLMDTGESRAALACLKWLVAMNPREVSGWLNLAVAQFTRGHYSEGITSCMTALAKDPGNVTAMYNLGLAHERLGQHTAAIEWVRRARRRDSRDIALQRLEFRLQIIGLKRRIQTSIRRYARLMKVW
ncbi:MAG: tetratricopeptide repeat protein, partial [Tepidisphaeraceae bacterium]